MKRSRQVSLTAALLVTLASCDETPKTITVAPPQDEEITDPQGYDTTVAVYIGLLGQDFEECIEIGISVEECKKIPPPQPYTVAHPAFIPRGIGGTAYVPPRTGGGLTFRPSIVTTTTITAARAPIAAVGRGGFGATGVAVSVAA